MNSAALPKKNKPLYKTWYKAWRFVERKFYRGKPYGLSVPFGQRILMPWFDDTADSDFARALATVRASGRLGVSADRCYLLFEFCRNALPLCGAMAECGVYTGGTAQLLALAISGSGVERHLHLFDTFQGMPDTSVPSRDYHSPGDFSNTSLEKVQARLKDVQRVCLFHAGLIPDTFAQVSDISSYSFVHVDVDIYPSVMDCCQWFWPRLAMGGIMIFDDYGFYPYRRAAYAAVNEYFADKPVRPIALPTGQGLIIKSAAETRQ